MMIVTFCRLVCPLNEYNNGRLCSCQGQLVLLPPMIFFWNQSSRICCDGLSVTLMCPVFLNEDGTMNGTMGAMVDGVMGILEWINANVDDDDDKFHHAGIEARVKQCIDEWKKKASDQMEEGSDTAQNISKARQNWTLLSIGL
jgi:hypothetical protein